MAGVLSPEEIERRMAAAVAAITQLEWKIEQAKPDLDQPLAKEKGTPILG